MSLLGDEKASERRFKISGKFTGGVGSSGVWNPQSTHKHGNDWEAESLYKQGVPTQSIGQRLAAAQKQKSLGSGPPKETVAVPGARKGIIKDTIKSKAVAVAKEAVRKKAKSVLSPRAQSEAARLENLFTR